MSAFRLDGKVAIITGGASGLGLAAAKAFLIAGVQGLTLVDQNEDVLADFAISLSAADRSRILLVTADVSEEADNARFVKQTIDSFGKLDIAVLNAGISQPGGPMSIVDTPVENWDTVMKVNSRGPFLGVKHCGKAMLASPSGGRGCSIVITSSQLGLDGCINAAGYSVSKFAMRGLMLCAAQEFGKAGIRCNAVAPGPIKTPMLSNWPADKLDDLRGQCILDRFGEPEEIANAMLYLASDASAYCSGTTLKVDGGWSKWA